MPSKILKIICNIDIYDVRFIDRSVLGNFSIIIDSQCIKFRNFVVSKMQWVLAFANLPFQVITNKIMWENG